MGFTSLLLVLVGIINLHSNSGVVLSRTQLLICHFNLDCVEQMFWNFRC